MPKFGAHIIFAEGAFRKRPDIFGDVDLAALRFGAVGPDTTLFMFDPATNDPSLRQGFETALSVLEAVSDLKDKLNAIVSELEKPFEDIADWLSGGLSADLSYLFNVGLEAMFLAAKLGLAQGVGQINVKNPIFGRIGDLPADFIKNPEYAARDWVISSTDGVGFPFRMFGHPFTDDPPWKRPLQPKDYSEWWWMDLLHYRRTGDFANELMASATTKAQRSYAKGYVTHVAGDVTGHPFINFIVGGPFRNHAYRHLVLETIADTWLWTHQQRGDILGSRLDSLINVSNSDADEIADLVIRSMRNIYQSPMVPRLLRGGYPEKDEFLFAYTLLKRYLRLSTGGTVKRPDPPPDSFSEVWEEIKDLLNSNQPGSPPVWTGSITDFIVALFTWFSKGITLLVMLATLGPAVLARIVGLAPRWAIYLVASAVYFIVRAIRSLLCLVGWGYLGSEDLETFGFLESMITTPGGFDNNYPALTMPSPKPPMYWLTPPPWVRRIEYPATCPMLPPRPNFKPDWLVSSMNIMDPAVVPALRQFGSAATPADTIRLENSLYRSSGFGNAIDFSIAMLSGTFPILNLDLDADRGIGFRGWEELPPGGVYV